MTAIAPITARLHAVTPAESGQFQFPLQSPRADTSTFIQLQWAGVDPRRHLKPTTFESIGNNGVQVNSPASQQGQADSRQPE